jgi:hypothetical protein
MSNTVCLQGKQPDPKQPGRTDPIVNGMAQLKSSDNSCPVCNATMPCLYDILAVRSISIHISYPQCKCARHLSSALNLS